MLYIAFVCIFLSIFLFTYNKNHLSKKKKKHITAKVIVSIIFSIKNIVFLKNIYIIIMSEDTPESAKLHYLKSSFCGNMPPKHLAMCSKTKRPRSPSKMIPQ